VKHQVGLSWNEVSRRYVDSEPSFYFPTTWRSRPEGSVKQGSGGELCNEQPSMDINKYTSATITNCVDLYKDLLAVGMCPEQARMFLPQNMLTEWIWSGSLYAFARVCNLRMDGHSQKETREVAYMISNIMEKLFPESWKVLVKGEEK
jgi:thymidylate synthase (FAD)